MIADDGPLILHDLIGDDDDAASCSTTRGDDPGEGWSIYLAHPADRTMECKVEVGEGHAAVHRLRRPHHRRSNDLALPPAGCGHIVSDDGIDLTLDLAATSGTVDPPWRRRTDMERRTFLALLAVPAGRRNCSRRAATTTTSAPADVRAAAPA